MLLDLIEKLINKSIELAKEAQKRKRELFSDFVEPLFKVFEEVHSDYVETFKKARELIKNTKEPLETNRQLKEVILEDALLSRGQRQKLIKLAASIKPEIISDFVKAIEEYLSLPFGFSQVEGLGEAVEKKLNGGRLKHPITINLIRVSMLDRALLPTDLSKEEIATHTSSIIQSRLRIFDNFLVHLQDRYLVVVLEYEKLKTKLLNNDVTFGKKR